MPRDKERSSEKRGERMIRKESVDNNMHNQILYYNDRRGGQVRTHA